MATKGIEAVVAELFPGWDNLDTYTITIYEEGVGSPALKVGDFQKAELDGVRLDVLGKVMNLAPRFPSRGTVSFVAFRTSGPDVFRAVCSLEFKASLAYGIATGGVVYFEATLDI